MTGLDLLGMVLVFAAVYATVEYRDWQRRDQDRRTRRLKERRTP